MNDIRAFSSHPRQSDSGIGLMSGSCPMSTRDKRDMIATMLNVQCKYRVKRICPTCDLSNFLFSLIYNVLLKPILIKVYLMIFHNFIILNNYMSFKNLCYLIFKTKLIKLIRVIL